MDGCHSLARARVASWEDGGSFGCRVAGLSSGSSQSHGIWFSLHEPLAAEGKGERKRGSGERIIAVQHGSLKNWRQRKRESERQVAGGGKRP